MKAILLCAGFATRLYPLTRSRAKPLLQIAGRPLLTDFVEQLFATESFDEILVVANDRFAADFEAWAQRLRPELTYRITALCREHNVLRSEVETLCQLVDAWTAAGTDQVDELRSRFEQFSARLEKNEDAEDALLMDAYFVDIGGQG